MKKSDLWSVSSPSSEGPDTSPNRFRAQFYGACWNLLAVHLTAVLFVVGPAFHVQLNFTQNASWALPDGTSHNDWLITWTQDITGAHGHNRAFVLPEIDDLVDQFLNAYLKANQDGGQ